MKKNFVLKKKYLTRKRQHNKIKTKYLRKSIKKYPKPPSNNIKKTKKRTKNVSGRSPMRAEMLEPKTTRYANASSLSTSIYGGIKPSEIELSAEDLGINFKPEVVPAVNKSLTSINNNLNYIVKLATMPDPPPDDINATEDYNKELNVASSQKKSLASTIGKFFSRKPVEQSNSVEIDSKTGNMSTIADYKADSKGDFEADSKGDFEADSKRKANSKGEAYPTADSKGDFEEDYKADYTADSK